MLYFLDESGHDHRESPYEVLAAVAIHERDLWNLIQAIRAAEVEFFGVKLADVEVELKGTRMLKRKTFRLAAEAGAIPPEERRNLVRTLFLNGRQAELTGAQSPVTFRELVAYGQAVVAFVERLFRLMVSYRVKTFAAIVDPASPRPNDDILRRDYAFLFERFFFHLEAPSSEEMGMIVFDELEKAQSRILLDQMTGYFLNTETGYRRSARIVPEPFFVHSDLTTAVQLADLVAYCANWAVRLNGMTKPARTDLEPLARIAFEQRFIGAKPDEATGQERPLYGFFYLDDLRPRSQRP